MSERNALIQQLNILREETRDENVSRTAGLALAALEMNRSKSSLQNLIPGVDLSRFNPTDGTGALSVPQIQQAVKTWLTSDLVTNANVKSVSSGPDTNLLNQIAVIITSCVNGQLSKDVCKDMIPELNDMNVQNVNLKLAKATLTALGFEINNNQVQSVEDWKNANSDVLSSIQINSNLLDVLNIFVQTLNQHPTDMDTTKLVPVNLNKDNQPQTQNMTAVILAINSEMDGMNFFQKYNASLLPIKAKNQGLVNMKGGTLISYDKDASGKPTSMRYNSFVDEQADTRKNFYTADVIKTYFEKLSSSLANNKINIEPSELDTIKKQIEKLDQDEKKLANISSTIEKYLALHRYWGANGKNDVPVADSIENIEKLLETHKEKFERVERKRKGLGSILYVLAQRVDSFIF